MKKIIVFAGLIALVLSLALVTGCGGDNAQAQTCAGCGMKIPAGKAKMIDGKPYCSHCSVKMAADKTGDDQVAVHDCDGGCGMKNVPIKQLTEINGKYYCQSCAAKVAHKSHEDHPH